MESRDKRSAHDGRASRSGRLRLVALVGLSVWSAGACASLNRTETGAVAGAAVGGIVGGLLDDHTARGAIIGAAIGGTAGAIIGRQMDRQAAELERELEGADVERVGEGIQVTFDSGLLFDFDSDALRSGARADLSELAASLQEYDNTDLIVVGHTDATGPDSYNMDLSLRRARAASSHLSSQGVARSRIATEGRGEAEPVATNDTDSGRQANRRVEVAIFASEEYRQELLRRGESGAPSTSDVARRLSFEIRGGLNRPIGDFRDAGGRGDASFGVDVFFDVTGDLALYAGWGRDQLSCETCAVGEGVDSQGFELGALYAFPMEGPWRPWLKAGGMRYEADAELPARTPASGGGIGFQLGAGVIFPLGDVLSVSPGIRFQRFTPDADVGGSRARATPSVS